MVIINRLVWKKENIDHIAPHNVSPEEVEEVCHSLYVARDAHGGRIMIIGPTRARRALCIILDPESQEGVWYPVTARPADRRERRKYKEETGVIL